MYENLTATEVLKAKDGDRMEAVYLVVNDPEMIRLILAWSVYGSVETKKKPVRKSNTHNELVTEAWDGCEPIDIDRLATLADLPRGTTKQKTDILIRQGLIYPDGTSSEKALVVIRAKVRSELTPK